MDRQSLWVFGVAPMVALLACVWGQPAVVLVPGADIDGTRAAAHTKALLQLAPERGKSQPDARARAAHWVAEQWRGVGVVDVRVEPFRASGYRGFNVYGKVRGQGQKGPLVLGAHLDAVEGSPGALDDAAAVGLLVELARVWRSSPPAGDVHLRVFDGEEFGLLGSRHSVLAGDRPSAALMLDVVGRSQGRLVMHGFVHTWLADELPPPPAWLVSVVLRSASATRYGDPFLSWAYQLIVRICKIPFGADDIPYRIAGIPAAFLSDFSFSLPFEHYHRATDTAALVGAPALLRVGKATDASVRSILESLPRASYGSEDYFVVHRWLIVGVWLWFLLAAALLPVLGLGARYGVRRWALLILGYGVACLADPVAALALLFFPVLGVGLLFVGPWRWVRWGQLVTLLPMVYCVTVLLWAMARHPTHMPLVGSPWLAAGWICFMVAWLGHCVAAQSRARSSR